MAKKFDTERETPNRQLLLFQALADEKRLQLLALLRGGEKNGVSLRKVVDIPQSSLSYHMRLLCDSGIVLARNQGNATFYRINRDISLNETNILAALLTEEKTDPRLMHGRCDFAAELLQDVRGSVKKILDDARLAQDRLSDPERTRDCLSKIEIAGRKLLYYTDEVLELARLTDANLVSEKVPLDLHYTAREIRPEIERKAEAKEVDFDICFRNVKDYRVRCDDTHLSKLLAKLLDNAVRFSESGGRVSLMIEQLPCDREDCGSYRFSVQDDGCGMSEHFLPQACEPFSREEDGTEGAGLGLTVAKRLTELLQGSLELRSEKGLGTTAEVSLILPLEKA